MRSMMFLMLRQAKNRFLELKAKPAKLVLYIVAIGFFAYVIIQSMTMETPPYATMDGSMFTAILAGFFMFTVIVTLLPAFSRGASFFEMQDVNYLFVAPIRPRTILLYGLVKMAKTIIIGSWFVILQANWMRSFGVGMEGVVFAGLAYILVAFVGQVLSLMIYATTNSRPRRMAVAKIILFVLFLPAIAVYVVGLVQGYGLLEALSIMMESPAFLLAPIVGVASAGVGAALFGEMLVGLLFFGLLLLAGAVFFCVIYFGNPDYYEDVLGATETAFEATRAAKEDVASAMVNTGREVKIKGTGVSGTGASVFFYKHLRESFRANRLGLWGFSSIFAVGGAIVWAVFVRSGEMADSPDMFLITSLTAMMMYKMLSMGLSRGLLETYSHYIYLMPDKPFSKWFWANIETVFKAAVEAVVAFVAAGIILGAPVLATASAMVAMIMFTFYLLGVSLASMRITDTHLNTGLMLMIYFAVVIIPLLPGLTAAIVVGVLVQGTIGVALAFLTLSGWMVLVGIGCFALSKGALHNCDMPVMREGLQ